MLYSRKALGLARIFQCAANTEQDSRGGENPTRQLSLRRKQSGRGPLATAAGEAPDVKGSYKRVSERAGPNMSEHRASLEKGNANADPVEIRGRLAGRGKRAKNAPRPYRRGNGEDMRATETCGNAGNPTRWEDKAPNQQSARTRLGREGSTRVLQATIVHLFLGAKGGGYRLATVFANLGVADRAVKRRERDRAFEPVVAGDQAP